MTEVKKIRKEVTPEDVSAFFDGRDPQERIVHLEYNYKDDFMKVYYRDENDNKKYSFEKYYPFLWAKLCVCVDLCDGNKSELKKLMRKYNIECKRLDITDNDGNEVPEMLDGYRYIFKAEIPMSYSKFLDFFKEAGIPVYEDKNSKTTVKKHYDKPYLVVTPQEQFLIHTGKRFFKGYDDYNELLRMIFDLETEGLDPTRHRIKLCGISLNRSVKIDDVEYNGFKKIYRLNGNTETEKNESELNIIKGMLRLIQNFKPDIITAHNGENFDWNFIIERCKVLGCPIEELSKEFFNGNSLYKKNKPSILKLGGEVETFKQTVVPTTITTDSLHAVRRAQALDSNMLRADLKYVVKYSNMVKKNRVYIPGEIIDKTLEDNEEHYAFNDETGDWYIYDPEYVEIGMSGTVVLEKNEDYYLNNPKAREEYDVYIKNYAMMNVDTYDSGNEFGSLFNEEVSNKLNSEINRVSTIITYDEWAQEKITEYKESKIKNGDEKFILHTRNVIRDGYELVSGRYIVARYLLDDLWECDKAEHKYNSTNFLICKLLPIPFQKVITMGTAGQWKMLLLAWSYENNLAIPPFGVSKSFTGRTFTTSFCGICS